MLGGCTAVSSPRLIKSYSRAAGRPYSSAAAFTEMSLAPGRMVDRLITFPLTKEMFLGRGRRTPIGTPPARPSAHRGEQRSPRPARLQAAADTALPLWLESWTRIARDASLHTSGGTALRQRGRGAPPGSRDGPRRRCPPSA